MKTDIQIAQEAEMLPYSRGGSKVLELKRKTWSFTASIRQSLSDELMERRKRQTRWKAGTCYCNQSDSGRRGKDDDHRWTWRGIGKAR